MKADLTTVKLQCRWQCDVQLYNMLTPLRHMQKFRSLLDTFRSVLNIQPNIQRSGLSGTGLNIQPPGLFSPL